jgi:hypothetical protein
MANITESFIVRKVYESFILGKCQCGCNEDIEIRSKHRPILKIFKKGHYINTNNPHKKGELSHMWKGGIFPDSRGYIKIYAPNHPKKHSADRVFQHRIIYEEYYNVCLLPWIDIHHKNKDIKDNRIENLQPITKSDHQSITHIKNMNDRICLICKYDNLDGSIREWYLHPITKEKWICKSCYYKIKYILKKQPVV